MSKKHGKQKSGFPWALVAIGGILLIVAAFFLASRGGEAGSGTPTIAVDTQRIDYGDVNFGVNKTFSIKVTNLGDGTLRFQEEPYIEVLEGC